MDYCHVVAGSFIFTYPIPEFALIVVKGKFPDSAFAKVKLLKNADFPTFGFPTIPIIILNEKVKGFIKFV